MSTVCAMSTFTVTFHDMFCICVTENCYLPLFKSGCKNCRKGNTVLKVTNKKRYWSQPKRCENILQGPRFLSVTLCSELRYFVLKICWWIFTQWSCIRVSDHLVNMFTIYMQILCTCRLYQVLWPVIRLWWFCVTCRWVTRPIQLHLLSIMLRSALQYLFRLYQWSIYVYEFLYIPVHFAVTCCEFLYIPVHSAVTCCELLTFVFKCFYVNKSSCSTFIC